MVEVNFSNHSMHRKVIYISYRGLTASKLTASKSFGHAEK